MNYELWEVFWLTLLFWLKMNVSYLKLRFRTDYPTGLSLSNGFLVSKETVVLRQWESEQKIWFYQTSL